MNKLSNEATQYLIDLVNTINPVRMEGAVIDSLGARAIDESGSFALLSPNTPEFPGDMALTRISQLKARLELVKEKKDFSIEYVLSDGDNPFIKSLILKAQGISATYRSGDPGSIRAPKKILDKPITNFSLSTDDVSAIQGAVNAFGPAKELQFSLNNGEVQFLVEDENGDSFSTNIGSTNYKEKLTHSYNAINISGLLKLSLTNGSVNIGIGERGILSIEKENFTFYVMPSKIGNS